MPRPRGRPNGQACDSPHRSACLHAAGECMARSSIRRPGPDDAAAAPGARLESGEELAVHPPVAGYASLRSVCHLLDDERPGTTLSNRRCRGLPLVGGDLVLAGQLENAIAAVGDI